MIDSVEIINFHDTYIEHIHSKNTEKIPFSKIKDIKYIKENKTIEIQYITNENANSILNIKNIYNSVCVINNIKELIYKCKTIFMPISIGIRS